MDRRANEIAHFSQLDHIWWGARTAAGQRRYFNKAQLMKRFCQFKGETEILEVGCGDGEFTKFLLELLPEDARVVGTDLTPAVIERARANFRQKNTAFAIADLEDLPFDAGKFDIVCGTSILHHVALDRALAEIHRVLKDKGEIYFTEPNMINPQIYLSLNINYLRKKLDFSPDETAFKRWELAKKLKEYEFTEITIRNIDFLHPLTPNFLIDYVEKISTVLEKTPLIKEISGTLLVHARKR